MMLETPSPMLIPDAPTCHAAVDGRDARYDGIFFVAIVTTRIYCRPVCPSRRARPENRRFFATARDATAAGYRPCLRCRPEPGEGRGPSPVDAVSRLAAQAAARIAAGALNGGSVSALSAELGVTDRHLRRALRRELGMSPVALAQSQRLRTAVHLLTESRLSITRVAYTSGFQSLRRFNAAFRAQFGASPRQLRARASAPES
jgi:AraC family transcriptional regulator of adaptative response / DNA-3-methyladenine glycosylase II